MTYSLRFFAVLICLAVLCLPSCTGDERTTDPQSGNSAPATPPRERIVKPTPRFDADSAYAYVARQVDFGPRVMNTEAHDQTRQWLVDKLSDFGAEVEEQKFQATAFDGTTLNSTNIIGRYNPERTDRVALYAHWDTRPFADGPSEKDEDAVVNGADDGASGVGVLLEVARQMGLDAADIGLDIVFLDAEDYGTSGETDSYGLGAQHYARTLGAVRPMYGILLDMVGAKDARFALEGVSMRFAPQVMDKVWTLAESMKQGKYFQRVRGGAVTDDHYFINTIAGVPTIDIINSQPDTQSGFVEHWHTGDDNMDVIDRETLRVVGQVVLATVFREAAGTL